MSWKKRREYHGTHVRERLALDSTSKGPWPAGPWDGEPDKVQWVDPATGLDCLIVRGPIGGLCGYVGVPETHPLYGKGYNDPVEFLGLSEYAYGDREWASPEEVLRVHGGITFSDLCDEPTEEEWLRIGEALRDPKLIAESAQYPIGDASRRLKALREQAGLTFQEWQDYQQGRRICHLPEPGRSGNVWWFGFDCAHSGDHCPGVHLFGLRGNTYRTIDYVRQEVESLAVQLAAMIPADEPAVLDEVEP